MEIKNKTMLQYKNQGEQIEERSNPIAPELSHLLGTWHNTKKESPNVKVAKFMIEDGELKIQAFGACEPTLCDWGKTTCFVFSDSIDSPVVTGLTANYDFGFKSTQIAGNIKQGILVLQVYNTFKDNSGRANYFSREFYYREA